MNRHALFAFALPALLSLPAPALAHLARAEVARDRREIREDRRELHEDRREAAEGFRR